MSDLGQQLRDYFETAGPPVDVEELIAGLDRRSSGRVRRLRTAVIAAAAVAAVVVVAGFVYAVLIRSALQPAPVVGDVPPPAPEPTVSQRSLPLGRPLVWEPAVLAGLEVLFGDGTTMYATGEDGTWYASEDGLVWRRLAVRAPESIVTGAPDFALRSVWRERFVFVSDVETAPEDEDAAVRVFVAHPDGSTDRTVVRPEAPRFRTLRVGPVAQGPVGVIVVGEGNNADKDGDLTGWVSADYETWTQIPDVGPFATRVPRVSLQQLVGVDDGFIALDENGAAWFSPDGLAWTQIGQDDRLAAQNSADDIVWLLPWRGDAVAMGPAGLWSVDSDGVSRLPVADSAPAPVADWGNIGVAAGGAGLAWTIADDTIAYSPDGIDWTRQQLPGDIGTVYAFAGPSMLVGANSVALQAERGGVWIGH